MSSNLDPLDRLNYFNGQRLEAGDLRLEQNYHIRLRRWLNRSLHTPGIAAGLEVLPVAGDGHKVRVSPGLALDEEGREIILIEEVTLPVSGVPSPVEGVVLGNYLTIRYAEAAVALTEDGCCEVTPPGTRLAWGGPTRVRSQAVLEWQNSWPAAGSGRIVLAQVELDPTCKVRNIRTGVRKYVGMTQPPRTMAYALEGEKDIDPANSKKIGFHIQGGRPQSILFYLKADLFSTLYYTEMGRHTHGINFDSASANPAQHSHGFNLGNLTTTTDGDHNHKATANVEDPEGNNALEMDPDDITDMDLAVVNFKIINGGAHSHHITGGNINTDQNGAHAHHLGGTSDATGQTGTGVRNGAPYGYVNGLRVFLDGTEVTAEICSRLGLAKLGDGTPTHKLAQTPPVEIELDTLGIDMTEGFHQIELKVDTGGGKILYNLYVE